jgi:hypothetical protein
VLDIMLTALHSATEGRTLALQTTFPLQLVHGQEEGRLR